jgi:hypothetical protein
LPIASTLSNSKITSEKLEKKGGTPFECASFEKSGVVLKNEKNYRKIFSA